MNVPTLCSPALGLTLLDVICCYVSLMLPATLLISLEMLHRVHANNILPPSPAPNILEPLPPSKLIFGHNFYWSPSTWGQMRRLAGIRRAPRPKTKSPSRLSQLMLLSVMIVVYLTRLATASVYAPSQYFAARRYAKLQSVFPAQVAPSLGSCCYPSTLILI